MSDESYGTTKIYPEKINSLSLSTESFLSRKVEGEGNRPIDN
jgi:hypothetical protein